MREIIVILTAAVVSIFVGIFVLCSFGVKKIRGLFNAQCSVHNV